MWPSLGGPLFYLPPLALFLIVFFSCLSRCFSVFYVLALWDLSFLTCIHCIGSRALTTGPPRKSLDGLFFFQNVFISPSITCSPLIKLSDICLLN